MTIAGLRADAAGEAPQGAGRLSAARGGMCLLIGAVAIIAVGLGAYGVTATLNGYSDGYGMLFFHFAWVTVLFAALLALGGAGCLLAAAIARCWRFLGELE